MKDSTREVITAAYRRAVDEWGRRKEMAANARETLEREDEAEHKQAKWVESLRNDMEELGIPIPQRDTFGKWILE